MSGSLKDFGASSMLEARNQVNERCDESRNLLSGTDEVSQAFSGRLREAHRVSSHRIATLSSKLDSKQCCRGLSDSFSNGMPRAH